MSSIPPPPFDPSTQLDYQGWYEMVNSIVGFVTASTQLASTLRNSRSCFPESQQITEVTSDGQCETSEVFNLVDFPWFLEELEEIAYEPNANLACYKPVFTDGPLLQFSWSQIANGEPNDEPRTITLIDTRDFGDISHPPPGPVTLNEPIASATVPPSAASEQSFLKEYTDSEQTIDSTNLQVNFEEADSNQALASGNKSSFEHLEEAEQLSTIYDGRGEQPHFHEKLVMECDVEEILLIQRSHSKDTKIVENKDEGVEATGVCAKKLKEPECEEHVAEIIHYQECFKELKDVKFDERNLDNYLDFSERHQTAVEAGKPEPIEIRHSQADIKVDPDGPTKRNSNQLGPNEMVNLLDKKEAKEYTEKPLVLDPEIKLPPLKGSIDPDTDDKSPALDPADELDLELSSIRNLLLIMDETEDADGKLNKELEAVKKALEFKNQLIRRFKGKCATGPDGVNSVKTDPVITPDSEATKTKEANSMRVKATKKELCIGKVDHITKNIASVQCKIMGCKQKKERADLNNTPVKPIKVSKTAKPPTPLKEVSDQKPTGKKSFSADMVKSANHQAARPSTRKQHSKNCSHPSSSDQAKPVSPTRANQLLPTKNSAEMKKSCLKSGVSSGLRAQKTCVIRELPTPSKRPAGVSGNTETHSVKKWLPIRDTTLKMTAAQTVKKAAEMLKNAEEKVLKPTSVIRLQGMSAVAKLASSSTGNRRI